MLVPLIHDALGFLSAAVQAFITLLTSRKRSFKRRGKCLNEARRSWRFSLKDSKTACLLKIRIKRPVNDQ